MPPPARALFAALLLASCALQALPARDHDAAEGAGTALDGHHGHQKPRRNHHRRWAGDGQDLSCEDVSDLDPAADVCAFVRQHCQAESIINYPKLYYCHVQRHGRLLQAAMLLACTALLVLLFRVIARAADEFFSCILSQISQDLGLPPRLGGVTLLALGNGAPDLSASIAAVKTGNYELALGALTGASMFVGCVVAGRIVTLSGGTKARGAQIRDIGAQFVTVATVMGIVASGYFTYGSVAALLSIYALYVVVVAVADFTHRMGVEWHEVAARVSRRWSSRFRVELTSPLLSEEDHLSNGRRPTTGPFARAFEGGQQQHGAAAAAAAAAAAQENGLDSRSSGPIAAPPGPPVAALHPFASAPPSIDARLAGTPPGGSRAASPPPASARGLFGSLPDLLTGRRHAQHEAHAQPHHTRHGPPVAHFQPHVPYAELVHMSAREYRQRALAEMAQSKSFYLRGTRGQEAADEELSDLEEDGSESSEYFSPEDNRSWDAHSRHSPEAQHRHAHAHAAVAQQQRDEEWGHGQLYQPPVVTFVASALEAAAAAEAGPRGGDAGAASAAAGLPPLHPGAAIAAAEGGRRFEHKGSGGSSNTSRSFGSAQRFSIASSGEAAAAAAAAAALAAVEEEQAGEGERPQTGLWRAADSVQQPIMVLLQSTVPLVEANSYSRPLFLRSMAASPLFVAAFCGQFSWQALLCALCAGAALHALARLGTRRLKGEAPLWTFGTTFPIGAALVALYGFAVAAMWIALFANEIVGMLQFYGMLSKVDPAVVGVTILAWGNSLMDYLNNTAMAARSRGGNSMAMTACFAGPLFNMLVGLGLGFWALLSESHMRRAAVVMDPVVLVGCIFIFINCTGLVALALLHRQRLPAWAGWAMVGLYAAYLSVVLTVLALT